jgi:hypothetical protein
MNKIINHYSLSHTVRRTDSRCWGFSFWIADTRYARTSGVFRVDAGGEMWGYNGVEYYRLQDAKS